MLTINEDVFLNELAEKGMDFSTVNVLLVEKLKEKQMKTAVAESCTGGLISQKITAVSGSSEVFDCGICSYSNTIKAKVLGVDETVLQTLGAVSSEVAIQMADGVKKLAESDVAVSTTGIAGPTGGTPQKPTGLVYIGIALPERTYCIKALFCQTRPNSRERVRELSATYALYRLYLELSDE